MAADGLPMGSAEQMPLAQVKNRSESLEETLEILSDASLMADLRELALVLARTGSDDGRRTSLDDVIAAFGFDRSEPEREFDADLAARRD